MLIFFIIAALLIFVIDGVPLIQKKQWAEFSAVVFILAAACILLIGKDAGIPSPIKSLDELLKDYGKKLFG